MDDFEPIIGLEIHVELKTKSKMFCSCSAEYFGHEPNTHCCPVCLGLPGALPVPNKKAIEWCIMLGMALNCEIPLHSKFDRKNYFYPDLPKGYQISQYDKPFATSGWLKIKDQKSKIPPAEAMLQALRAGKNEDKKLKIGEEEKIIRIRRVHMEEDTGKLLHATVDGKPSTLIDFNRSGVPLVEIVTEPDIRSSEEAKLFLKNLHQIIRYLGISDADMEKGSMRLEPNISVLRRVRPSGNSRSDPDLPIYKVELKNINSFNFAKKAIDFEIARHIEILKNGDIPTQETRGWDDKRGVTISQRSKEQAHDYRYFPDPDIPPVVWSREQITEIKSRIKELPDKKYHRFIKNYGLSSYDTTILIETQHKADYYEEAVKVGKHYQIKSKTIANWLINKKINSDEILPAKLIETILQETHKQQLPEEELKTIIDDVIKNNPKAITDYKKGKENAIMFLVGQVMRVTSGRIAADVISRSLIDRLTKN